MMDRFEPQSLRIADPKRGAYQVNEFILVDLWREIHTLSYVWSEANSEFNLFKRPTRTELRVENYLLGLSVCPHTAWSSLCSAAGWTVYGAVALSWCKDARLEDVWAGWLASGFPLKPLPEFERPARFLNPDLVPQVKCLTEIATLYNGKYPGNPEMYHLAVSATIAAQKAPLEFDFQPEQLKGIPPQIAAFLKSRLLQKTDKSGSDKMLIESWSASIKGTEWDVWEEKS